MTSQQQNASNDNSEPKTIRLLQAAAVLTFAASIVTVAISWLYFSAVILSWGYRPQWVNGVNLYFMYYLAVAIVGAVSFVFGLMSVFCILKRLRFRFAVFGLVLLVVCGVLMSIPLYFFGLPIFALSALAFLFVGLSKAQFSQ